MLSVRKHWTINKYSAIIWSQHVRICSMTLQYHFLQLYSRSLTKPTI